MWSGMTGRFRLLKALEKLASLRGRKNYLEELQYGTVKVHYKWRQRDSDSLELKCLSTFESWIESAENS